MMRPILRNFLLRTVSACKREGFSIRHIWSRLSANVRFFPLSTIPYPLISPFPLLSCWLTTSASPLSLLNRPRTKALVPRRRSSHSDIQLEVDLNPSTLAPDQSQQEYVAPTDNPIKGQYTPLIEEIYTQIHLRGPLSLAEYMEFCMQHPRYGYYMSKQNIIGSKQESKSDIKGDFITSPEISQVFGESIGIWCVDIWMKLAQPKALHLVELGPGRGTLIKDVLRTIRSFRSMHKTITVHLVETSPIMRETQMKTLEVADIISTTVPSNSRSKEEATIQTAQTKDGITIYWHQSLLTLPSSNNSVASTPPPFSRPSSLPCPFLFLAHEFFDSLPIHTFEFTSRGWCEQIVDYDTTSTSPYHFRFVLSNGVSPGTLAFELDKRKAKIGERIEVSAAGLSIMNAMCEKIDKEGGAALLIDYGYFDKEKEGISKNSLTLQAVQDHEYVHPFHQPGQSDITALVDFQALTLVAYRNAALCLTNRQGVQALPIINQSSFLRNCNIAALLEKLINGLDDPKEIEREIAAATRLVEEGEGKMGSLFKVFAIVSKNLGVPLGWAEKEVQEKWKVDERIIRQIRAKNAIAIDGSLS